MKKWLYIIVTPLVALIFVVIYNIVQSTRKVVSEHVRMPTNFGWLFWIGGIALLIGIIYALVKFRLWRRWPSMGSGLKYALKLTLCLIPFALLAWWLIPKWREENINHNSKAVQAAHTAELNYDKILAAQLPTSIELPGPALGREDTTIVVTVGEEPTKLFVKPSNCGMRIGGADQRTMYMVLGVTGDTLAIIRPGYKDQDLGNEKLPYFKLQVFGPPAEMRITINRRGDDPLCRPTKNPDA